MYESVCVLHVFDGRLHQAEACFFLAPRPTHDKDKAVSCVQSVSRLLISVCVDCCVTDSACSFLICALFQELVSYLG